MNDEKQQDSKQSVNIEDVESKIMIIRQQEVLLDRDVAEIYGVETREVNQAVRNNPRKFRAGYMFELTNEESAVLRSNNLSFGELLTDIVMPDLQTNETETHLELNFVIGKLKHTVKRVRKESPKD